MRPRVLIVIITLAIIYLLVSLVNSKDKSQFQGKSLVKEKTMEVNVYSSRKETLVRDLFDEFSRINNVKVNYITDDPSKLIARMESEGNLTKADLFISADVTNLILAEQRGLLQEINSQILNDAIPENLRSDKWFGLTKRARVIVYAKDRVDVKELDSYEGLADSKWKGKVLVRSSNSPYNQSLLASIIRADGERAARSWVKGLVDNFARSPQGGDIDQIRAVEAGEGDVAIVNSYYYARLLASDLSSDKEIADKVGIYFPNQDGRGTMMNISGAAVVKHARNKLNAISLLEFMVSPNAQNIYAQNNQEYPVLKSVKLSPVLAKWPDYKQDEASLLTVGSYMKQAIKIADEEGWR
ncbi:MAG: extracellular solute-binding protein [Rickettsiaceae bacterium H1]|nr:extracellular solute-binding protein [Rickettsiaceae bacterium H1]